MDWVKDRIGGLVAKVCVSIKSLRSWWSYISFGIEFRTRSSMAWLENLKFLLLIVLVWNPYKIDTFINEKNPIYYTADNQWLLSNHELLGKKVFFFLLGHFLKKSVWWTICCIQDLFSFFSLFIVICKLYFWLCIWANILGFWHVW